MVMDVPVEDPVAAGRARPPAANEARPLELVDVVKRFKGVPAVDGISLAVEAGEFVSLVGPSGCGKTTTLQMVGGFLTSDEGEVRLHGQRVNDLPPNRRDVGLVFQSFALFPHMTAVENVAYGLKMRRVGKRERIRRAQEALTMVGLENTEGRLPRELSGGQRQRVALARALVFNPGLLLLDEPLSNLDAKMRHQMRAELKQIQREFGTSTLFVTHDQEEALSMSDRVIVVNQGRIEQSGTPREIYRRPATPFVARFIGESNVWEATATTDQDGRAVLTLGSGLRLVAESAEVPADDPSVLVTVRPEGVTLTTVGAGSREQPNVFQGVVSSSSYLGARVEYRVLLDGAESVQVSCPGESAQFDDGDRVEVSWPASACRVVR
jgi:putative spermidine/putrescine transport system ATP-binding protein